MDEDSSNYHSSGGPSINRSSNSSPTSSRPPGNLPEIDALVAFLDGKASFQSENPKDEAHATQNDREVARSLRKSLGDILKTAPPPSKPTHSAAPAPTGAHANDSFTPSRKLASTHEQIQYLQSQISHMKDMIVSLEPERATPAPGSLRDETLSKRYVESHLHSVSSTRPTSNLESIALSLRLVQQLDQLVDGSNRSRRDEDVFSQENIERIYRRIAAWASHVRSNA